MNTTEQRLTAERDQLWVERCHQLTVACSLEAAVQYLTQTDVLTIDQLRARLRAAITQAHESADRMYPLPVVELNGAVA